MVTMVNIVQFYIVRLYLLDYHVLLSTGSLNTSPEPTEWNEASRLNPEAKSSSHYSTIVVVRSAADVFVSRLRTRTDGSWEGCRPALKVPTLGSLVDALATKWSKRAPRLGRKKHQPRTRVIAQCVDGENGRKFEGQLSV